ncbi:tetratricopeptide repeat-containing sensor histidine kinase [Parvularcula maris]|uniref:histidine kinase n=1 Tax=Parvularcula maris TaxID=2965077 RepID=A0A9X2LBF9_9PROT|nr:tetratricopeptide repeat protein [Parvularcula maris]MCQ8186621.1 tetratricopeptide repeat protein [Parvularcula maris]
MADRCLKAFAKAGSAQQSQFARRYVESGNATLEAEKLTRFEAAAETESRPLFRAMALPNDPSDPASSRYAELLGLLEDGRHHDDPHKQLVALRGLFRLAYDGGDFEAAAEHAQNESAIARGEGMRRAEAVARIRLGSSYLRAGATERAVETYRQALAMRRDLSDQDLKRLCGQTSSAVSNAARMDEEALNSLIRAAEESGEAAFEICLRYGAVVRSNVRGDIEKAREMAEAILEDLRAPELARLAVIEPQLRFQISATYYRGGDLPRAVRGYQEVIDQNQGDILLQVRALNSLAAILGDMGEYETAIGMVERAIDLSEDMELPNEQWRATLLTNIGWARGMQGRHEDALRHFDDAERYVSDDPSATVRGFMHYARARSLEGLGRSEEAITEAQRAVPVILLKRNPLEAAAVLIWLSEQHLEAGDTALAEQALAEATAITERDDVDRDSLDRDTRFNLWELRYHTNMARLMRRMGRAEDGIDNANRALALSEARFERESLQATSTAQLRFEISDRERALELLRSEAEVRELRLQRTQTWTAAGFALFTLAVLAAFFAYIAFRNQRRLAAAQTTFLRETQHRAGNNLHLICSLLNLGARQPSAHSDAVSLANSTADRARTMALIHHHLYREGQERRADPKTFFDQLAEMLEASLGRDEVKLVTDVENVPMDADEFTPIGLIACELITNAYKHAFGPEGGEIRVSVSTASGSRVLEIADDGRGFDSTSTPNPSGDTFHGLQLLEDLAHQVSGRLSRPLSKEGTVWRVTF